MKKEEAIEMALKKLYHHTKPDIEINLVVFKKDEYYECEEGKYYIRCLS